MKKYKYKKNTREQRPLFGNQTKHVHFTCAYLVLICFNLSSAKLFSAVGHISCLFVFNVPTYFTQNMLHQRLRNLFSDF